MNLIRRNEKPDDISLYDQYNNALRHKQIEIEQNQETIKLRHKEIEKKRYEVDKLEQLVNEKQKTVSKIEIDLEKYKVLMSNAVDNLNTSQETLENTITYLETKV